MTAAERNFWLRVTRRASALSPEISSAILKSFRVLAAALPEGELAKLIESGRLDHIVSEMLNQATLDKAFQPVKNEIRSGISRAATYFAHDLPKDAALGFAFDVLNPKVITAIRELETKVITTLADGTRETVRAYIENGLRDGVNPRTVARNLRSVIGLAPNQEEAVRNFRAMLEAGDREALTRTLRDKRFDATLKRLLGAKGEGLKPEQIERMADAYRKRMVAFNAETHARTAALDAQKLGQKLSWDQAVADGSVDGSRLMKRWSGTLDDRERDSHLAMQGDTAHYDQPYSNRQMIPGDSEWNCRCLSLYGYFKAT